MRNPIQRKADLENLLGKTVASRLLRELKNAHRKRLPSYVNFLTEKPSYALGDGDILIAYGVDMTTGAVLGERFCGSGDTAINHVEQGMTGKINNPNGVAAVFLHSYWNGRNHSWTLDFVSKDGFPNLKNQSAS